MWSPKRSLWLTIWKISKSTKRQQRNLNPVMIQLWPPAISYFSVMINVFCIDFDGDKAFLDSCISLYVCLFCLNCCSASAACCCCFFIPVIALRILLEETNQKWINFFCVIFFCPGDCKKIWGDNQRCCWQTGWVRLSVLFYFARQSGGWWAFYATWHMRT